MPSPSHRSLAWRFWIAWLAGTLVASLPLFFAPIPPLGQHFFNLVRIEILVNPAAYARDFAVRWDIMPDLAMDLTVPWIAKLIGVQDASRLFLFMTFTLLTSGTLMLSRAANGRWSVLPSLSFLVLYNWILVRGYENNLFGFGLSLWALAAHIALRRSTAARVLVSSCSALVIYFCHLFPLAVFALVIGTWELGCLLEEGLSPPRVLSRAAAALLPLALPTLLLWLSSTGELGGAIEFGVLRIWTKIKLAIESLTFGNRLSDGLLLVSLGGTGVLALSRKWLRCERECRLTVIALPLVAVFAPFSAFASVGIVERCGVSFAFLLAALLDVRPVDHRLQRAVAGALSLVFLIRVGTVTSDWRAAQGILQSYRMTFASLEPGSVMFQFDQDTGYPSPLRDPYRWNPPLDKIIALATLNGVLVPELYLKRGQQPVVYRSQNGPLRAFQFETEQREPYLADEGMLQAWAAKLRGQFPDLQSRFRAVYVAVYDPRRRLTDEFPGGELVATLPEHRLYKLIR